MRIIRKHRTLLLVIVLICLLSLPIFVKCGFFRAFFPAQGCGRIYFRYNRQRLSISQEGGTSTPEIDNRVKLTGGYAVQLPDPDSDARTHDFVLLRFGRPYGVISLDRLRDRLIKDDDNMRQEQKHSGFDLCISDAQPEGINIIAVLSWVNHSMSDHQIWRQDLIKIQAGFLPRLEHLRQIDELLVGESQCMLPEPRLFMMGGKLLLYNDSKLERINRNGKCIRVDAEIPEGRNTFVSCDSNKVRLYDADTGQPINEQP